MTQLKRFQDTLVKSDLDCAIISSALNQRYLCDFDYSDGYILVCPDKAYLLTDFRYIEAARASVKDFEIIVPSDTALKAIGELIANGKYTRIAIEEASLSCAKAEQIKKELPSECALLHGASEMLIKQRAVKLDYELERIEKAQQITDAAFAHVLPMLSQSITERDVALELEFFMRKMGAEATAFDTIAVSGCASALPHGVPDNVKLRQGFLTMDFGAKYLGYCSDMTRTVVIGKADEEIKKVYNTVLRAQTEALDKICGGMLCRDADEVARSIIREAGYGSAFGHSLGHGVGMYIHESPSLSPRAPETSRLCTGNVVTVEPGIYLEGRFGCRIEDMISICPDGTVHNFTKSSKELIEI